LINYGKYQGSVGNNVKRTVNFPCSYTQFASLFGTIVRSAEISSGVMVAFGWADLSQVTFYE